MDKSYDLMTQKRMPQYANIFFMYVSKIINRDMIEVVQYIQCILLRVSLI